MLIGIGALALIGQGQGSSESAPVDPSGPTNGILLEDGSGFLLAEDGSYLVQE